MAELGFGPGEADAESFDLAEPTFPVGLGNPVVQVVADLHEVIAVKAEHRAPKPAEGEEAAAGPVVVNLMAALEKSVAEARERRGETGSGAGAEATVHEMPKPKKTAAKKTTVKKAAAATKKSPVKKTASRRRKSA
ncbi:hypothetical protein ACFQ7J_02255 [Streptomyces sp. NPDC056501]|uniref:hypothetical protein n=1 Tax=Streptomyces sp. NPDC056501 TaxID=3345841 RepID=UPI0036CCFE72